MLVCSLAFPISSFTAPPPASNPARHNELMLCDSSGPADNRVYFPASIFPCLSHKATYIAVYKESWHKSENFKYSCRECLQSSISSYFFVSCFPKRGGGKGVGVAESDYFSLTLSESQSEEIVSCLEMSA